MKKLTLSSVALAAIVALTGCGGGGSSSQQAANTGTGHYLDSAVEGVEYTCGVKTGKTDKEGTFVFEEGKDCKFTLAGIPLKEIKSDELFDNVTVVESDPKVARFLQSIDSDGDPSNGISITDKVADALNEAVEDLKKSGDLKDPKEVVENNTTLGTVVAEIQSDVSDFKGHVVTPEEAKTHLEKTQTDVTKKYLVGKTWYLPVTDEEYKHVEKLTFKENGSVHIEWDNADGNHQISDSISYSIDGNNVHFTGTGGDGDFVDYTATIISFSNNALVTKDGVFYKSKSDAEAYLKTLSSGASGSSGDLSWIIGKTFYQHCNDDGHDSIDTLTFQGNGKIRIVEGGGDVEEVPYEIDGTTIYTIEDGVQKAHHLIESTDTYFKMDDDGGTSSFYLNRSDAQNAPADDCGEGDSGASGSSGDLSWIIGKTFYQHCNDDGHDSIDTLTFQGNGKIRIVEGGGDVEEIPYEIDGTTMYTINDGVRKAHHLIESTDTYLKMDDDDGTTSIYLNRSDAQNARADDCGEGD